MKGQVGASSFVNPWTVLGFKLSFGSLFVCIYKAVHKVSPPETLDPKLATRNINIQLAKPTANATQHCHLLTRFEGKWCCPFLDKSKEVQIRLQYKASFQPGHFITASVTGNSVQSCLILLYILLICNNIARL